MDKLEKHIIQNREALDRRTPDPEIWNTISAAIPVKKIGQNRFLKIAATIAIIIGTSLTIFNLSTWSVNSKSNPELLESELYYNNRVENLMKEVQPSFTSNPEMADYMMNEISNLEKIYADIKKDLKDNVKNEEVVEALIMNYRVRIEILEEMQRIVKGEKSSKENLESYEL